MYCSYFPTRHTTAYRWGDSPNDMRYREECLQDARNDSDERGLQLSRGVWGWTGAFVYTTLLGLVPEVDWRVLPGVALISASVLLLAPKRSQQWPYFTAKQAVLFGAAYLWLVAVVLLKPSVPEVTSAVTRFMPRPVTLAVGALPVAAALSIGLARLIGAFRPRT